MKKQLKNNPCSKQEAFEIIVEYLQEQLELCEREMLDKTSFELPAWAEYQAYQLGVKKALLKVKAFIPDPEKKVE